MTGYLPIAIHGLVINMKPADQLVTAIIFFGSSSLFSYLIVFSISAFPYYAKLGIFLIAGIQFIPFATAFFIYKT